jgi:prepilin-type N-terminal cleavage/methylation domain-containing protein
MKHSFARSRSSRLSGFTLVELLVVIAIIAVLASVIIAASGMAIKMAQRVKASNMATQIQTAVLSYYTEYSVYPVPPNTTTDYMITEATGSAGNWGSLLQALCGNIKPSTGAVAAPVITNLRGIAFLTLKSTDVDNQDAPLNPLPPSGGASPYFNIAMDSDYDGSLGLAGTTANLLPRFDSTATPINLTLAGGSTTTGVAVWANCTGKPKNAKCNSGWWVHTY